MGYRVSIGKSLAATGRQIPLVDACADCLQILP